MLAAGGAVSVQVLNELVQVPRRKLQRGWAKIEAGLDDRAGVVVGSAVESMTA